MVRYWRSKDSVAAKVTKAKDGSIIMIMEGEDYPFPTFPRGHILLGKDGGYSQLSVLKHQIKNQIFNESWAKIHSGVPSEEIIKDIKNKLFKTIPEHFEPIRYDMLPIEKMCPSVREIHRAWTKVAPESTYILRDYLCFILQEDDAYRFRVQWIVKYFNPKWLLKTRMVKIFLKSLQMVEHAEVIGDMKERIKLLRTVLEIALSDPNIKELFIRFCKEANWKKIKLSKGDSYHFRGKYFKVDMDVLEY